MSRWSWCDEPDTEVGWSWCDRPVTKEEIPDYLQDGPHDL